MGWYYFFVYRCDPPPHWVPAFVKGPDWKDDRVANRYAEDLTFHSGGTASPFIVNTWRHRGRPGDRWEDLGWSNQACH